ncbi:MAG: class I poly(R)-hydroxyalkanoic acid synthase [Alphaproteobacteria bacterium]|nr:MAG: class I poly(R)-hydroxyalkanoic acid synthase [Alphaproteobacteria bacterium]
MNDQTRKSGQEGARPPGEQPAQTTRPPYADYVLKDPEAFARNLARMIEEAGRAAAAWVGPREAGRRQDDLAESVAEISKTLGKVSEYWLSDPERALQAQTQLFSRYMELWNSSIRRMAGEEVPDPVATDPGDRRFADPEWSHNQFFNFLKQAYLITSGWAADLVERTEGLDEHTKHKAVFYTQQLINSLSPSNFPATNPEVLRDTIASHGENLVRGMKMLAEDIRRGDGELKLRQADHTAFEVGRDVANTPGKVIAQNDVCQVIQYEAATEKVLQRPLVIVPPWINKFYILDLNPQKSFIKWCVDQGHTVFVISWVNPDERQAGKSFEHYAREGIVHTLDVVEEVTGEREMNVVGYCVGGTLLAVTLALMARWKDDRAKTATFLTTQVDFTHAGDLKVFVDEEQIARVEKSMATKGYLEGAKMATAFNMLRSRDLIWPYVVNNYLRGKDPLPFDLLYWNSDATRMPAANHSFYLRACYLENRLTQGAMEVAGERLDLSEVTIPIYNLATREDHIAPARSAYLGSQFFGGKATFVLTGSGHIAGVVNPPAARKYQYWTGGKPVGELDGWLKTAEEHPGSWWPHWHDWIRANDAREVAARKVGSDKHPPIEDAPGSYVLAKA